MHSSPPAQAPPSVPGTPDAVRRRWPVPLLVAALGVLLVLVGFGVFGAGKSTRDAAQELVDHGTTATVTDARIYVTPLPGESRGRATKLEVTFTGRDGGMRTREVTGRWGVHVTMIDGVDSEGWQSQFRSKNQIVGRSILYDDSHPATVDFADQAADLARPAGLFRHIFGAALIVAAGMVLALAALGYRRFRRLRRLRPSRPARS